MTTPSLSSPDSAKTSLPLRASTLCIVVGLDFTDADGPAFDQGARIATRVPGSQLHLLHVLSSSLSPERQRDLVDHLKLYVSEKSAIGSGLRAVGVGVHLRVGKPVRELIQLANDVRADFIVVGSHKGVHPAAWIGESTVDQLVRAGLFPVLVAGAAPSEPLPHEPVIEPPCPQCVQERIASAGGQWWCSRHASSSRRDSSYSEATGSPMSFHDSEVIPTGIDF